MITTNLGNVNTSGEVTGVGGLVNDGANGIYLDGTTVKLGVNPIIEDTALSFDPRVNFIGFGGLGGGGDLLIGNDGGEYKIAGSDIDQMRFDILGGGHIHFTSSFFEMEYVQIITLSASVGGDVVLASGGMNGNILTVSNTGVQYFVNAVELIDIDTSGNITAPTISCSPTISSGAVAPASTPDKVGDIYVDTVAKKLYFATGTASSADWTIAN